MQGSPPTVSSKFTQREVVVNQNHLVAGERYVLHTQGIGSEIKTLHSKPMHRREQIIAVDVDSEARACARESALGWGQPHVMCRDDLGEKIDSEDTDSVHNVLQNV
jgi:hypothetical protein